MSVLDRYLITCHGEHIMATCLRAEAVKAWRAQQEAGLPSKLWINGEEHTKVPPAPPGRYIVTPEGIQRVRPPTPGYSWDLAERYFLENSAVCP